VHTIPPFSGEFVTFDKALFSEEGSSSRSGSQQIVPACIQERLVGVGVTQLFKHQASAIEASLLGHHVAISTGTSSGKSVCFNVPVLEKILSEPSAVALYMFPTKALAQDQLQSFRRLVFGLEEGGGGSQGQQAELADEQHGEHLREHGDGGSRSSSSSSSSSGSSILGRTCRPAVVDGDTLYQDRHTARECANVIMTNPDMLHITLLPNHAQWSRVLRNLRYVVVDEAHVYRGIFGAHVSLVLARLVRLCQLYGNSQGPQFIYCSATIANVAEHFEQLLPLRALPSHNRRAITVVSEDTAPRGEKLLLLWNPTVAMVAPYSASSRDLAGSDEGCCSSIAGDESSSHAAVQSFEAKSCEEGGGGGGGDREGAVLGERGLSTKDKGKRGKKRALPKISNHEEDEAAEDDQPTTRRSGFPMGERRRTSTLVESSRVFTALVKSGVRVLCFSRTRKITELVLRYSQQDLKATAPALVPLIRGYRGGYTKADRRSIERDFFSRRLLGVAATRYYIHKTKLQSKD
jgi:DEAD/DEAH box helicase domain-containing protein